MNAIQERLQGLPVAPIGGFARFDQQAAGFVERLLDIGLDGRGGERAAEGRLVKDFPGMIHLVFGSVDSLDGLQLMNLAWPEKRISGCRRRQGKKPCAKQNRVHGYSACRVCVHGVVPAI
jgi:hypothetical protein